MRQRASDIALLVHHLMEHIAQRLGMAPPQVPAPVLELLGQQPWPGNVRQLANLLERGIILSEDGTLTEDTVLPFLDAVQTPTPAPANGSRGTASLDPEEDDEARVRRALLEAGGDKHQAAAALGCSYATLQRRVKRYDLEGFPKYRD